MFFLISFKDRDDIEETGDVDCTTTSPAPGPADDDGAANAPVNVAIPSTSTGVGIDALTTPTCVEELDPDMLDILGVDPTITKKFSTDINKDLASRFLHIVTLGLDKENRKQLMDKYLVPANCSHIGAPILNAEIKAALPDTVIRRDKAIEARQKGIAAAISCLGQTISTLLSDKSKNHELLKQLMDSSRIMCDIQYSESVSRRNFALYSLKKDMKEQLATTKIDNFLFGENLAETLRTAKAVTKSSTDLKMEAPKKVKPQPTHATRGLNWKTGPGNRRAAPGAPRRPPPPPPPAPGRPRPASSRASSQRTRPTTRR